jgi:hypothetical protein
VTTTINAPCGHGWPARECDRHPRRFRVPLYAVPLLIMGGVTAIWCAFLARLAWTAAQAVINGAP